MIPFPGPERVRLLPKLTRNPEEPNKQMCKCLDALVAFCEGWCGRETVWWNYWVPIGRWRPDCSKYW